MKKSKLNALITAALSMLTVLPIPAIADEGHHYMGASGFGTEFFLIGGQYHLYVNAHQTFARGTSRNLTCVFTGHLSRIRPTQDTLTMGPVQIHTRGYTLDNEVTLPVGFYRLHIATDCPWNFFISSTPKNAAGVSEVQMLITSGGKAQLATTASLSDSLQFSADFRTDHNAEESVSGKMQIIHDGQVIGTLPLQSGVGLPIRGQSLFVEMHLRPGDDKYVGKNIAKFIVKIGSVEFTTSAEFTLTP